MALSNGMGSKSSSVSDSIAAENSARVSPKKRTEDCLFLLVAKLSCMLLSEIRWKLGLIETNLEKLGGGVEARFFSGDSSLSGKNELRKGLVGAEKDRVEPNRICFCIIVTKVLLPKCGGGDVLGFSVMLISGILATGDTEDILENMGD